MSIAFPFGFAIRPPAPDDLEAINELITTCAIADDGTDAFTVHYRPSDWELLGFQRETDAWVVSAPDEQMVGYASVWPWVPGRFGSESHVHPNFSGRGIGTALLGLIEERTGQLAQGVSEGLSVTLMQEISARNEAARHLLAKRGFSPIRHIWQMVITLNGEPPAPSWPVGIQMYRMIAGQDERSVYEAVEEAFAGNRGHVPVTFEQWTAHRLRPEYFDPSLWFLATDGPELAGVALCRYQREMGWVSILAVRPRWRKQGLGMALLRHAFSQFHQRGTRQIGLSVDSQNTSGATRLYKRTGMRVARQDDRYEKTLRPDGNEALHHWQNNCNLLQK